MSYECKTNKKKNHEYGNAYLTIVDEINISPKKNKKIISYCLYGLNLDRNSRRDFDKGAYVNYHFIKNSNYPDWVMRIYLPYDEPVHVIEKLRKFQDIELILVDTNVSLRAIRFLPNDDPNVFVWLSRDLDSIVNAREEKAVEDWLENRKEKELMLMSDSTEHKWAVNAGMFGKVKSRKNNVVNYILRSRDKKTSIAYDDDAKIAEKYFLKKDNYVQYYRAGKKLENHLPFPDLSPIHCVTVGNISPMLKYYIDLGLEELYPFLSYKSDVVRHSRYYYEPWKLHFKLSTPLCSFIKDGDDFVMTVDPKRSTGVGTWRTINGDGIKLLKLNTHIQILWEDQRFIEAFKPDKNTINVKHGESWHSFRLLK